MIRTFRFVLSTRHEIVGKLILNDIPDALAVPAFRENVNLCHEQLLDEGIGAVGFRGEGFEVVGFV